MHKRLVISKPSHHTSLVIQGYLNGKSRDQIAKEIEKSTGTVSNIMLNVIISQYTMK
jgi:DNA-binding NarL/FixJ family response regulator